MAKKTIVSESSHCCQEQDRLLLTNAHAIIVPLMTVYLLTLIFQLTSLAYSTSQTGQSFQSVLWPSLFMVSVVTLPLAALGLHLGRQFGLGTPLLLSLLYRQTGALQRLYKEVRLAIILGIIFGATMLVVRMLVEPYLPVELPAFGHRGVWGGLLVSAGAAMGEETWFRLGVMTIVIWLLARLAGHKELRPAVAWAAIIVVAFSFGIAHLPQLISYGANSTFAVLTTVMGNVVVAIMYGWCFWRHSLFCAVTAHFAVDVVLHVLPALFV